jgi:hypothetical protein
MGVAERLFRTERQVACFRKSDGASRVSQSLRGGGRRGDALSAQNLGFRDFSQSFSKLFQAFAWIFPTPLQRYQGLINPEIWKSANC